ncbi:MAG TPA: SRPBCC domain-containing protein [Candidatus Dormibacteraeota bacterium]|nr:SRPBCC domain-containing protein [Candidatus Dormibacteraeota bacterium]
MASKSNQGARILGSLRSADGKGIVRIEERYETGIDDMWSAITDPRRLAEWNGEYEGDFRVGGEYRIHIESDGWDGVGRVERCEPPRRLVVTSRESDESFAKGQGAAPFDERIDVMLRPDGKGTVLIAEIGGLPLDKIAFYGAGWQIHAETLAAYLAGSEPVDVPARWGDVLPAYERLAADLR